MVLTLVVFVSALVAMSLWVRPHLIPPVTARESVKSASGFGFTLTSGPGVDFIVEPPDLPNAWVLSSGVVDASGHGITSRFVSTACPQIIPIVYGEGDQGPGGKTAVLDCVRTIAQTYHIETMYQPAGRYWMFQWMETGIFVVLALGLAGVSVWWIRRRIV
jgi:hypothetical protein